MVELKKCCNHPFLFESADHGYGGDTNFLGSAKLERIILSSGKLVILDKLLDRLHETNHRVLIFSQVNLVMHGSLFTKDKHCLTLTLTFIASGWNWTCFSFRLGDIFLLKLASLESISWR